MMQKEVVEYQYQQADADIRADTQTEYEDEISTYYEEKRYQNQKRMQVFCGILKTGNVILECEKFFSEK